MRSFPLPVEFRQKVPQGNRFFRLTQTLDGMKLNTVCEQAKCPNRTGCYARGTLAFQILGDVCTRRCGFCAEKTGRPGAVDPSEAERLLDAARQLSLRHIVITAPARDDLPDGGASVFCEAVDMLKKNLPQTSVEVLISDLAGNERALNQVLASSPDILNHNIETVERLTPKVRAKATYAGSLRVLEAASKYQPHIRTKSGFMVGLGETEAEIMQVLRDLRKSGVQYLTVGQYLPPSEKHVPLERYYSAPEFDQIEKKALSFGFDRVFSGALVRSSYHADEMAVEF